MGRLRVETSTRPSWSSCIFSASPREIALTARLNSCRRIDRPARHGLVQFREEGFGALDIGGRPFDIDPPVAGGDLQIEQVFDRDEDSWARWRRGIAPGAHCRNAVFRLPCVR